MYRLFLRFSFKRGGENRLFPPPLSRLTSVFTACNCNKKEPQDYSCFFFGEQQNHLLTAFQGQTEACMDRLGTEINALGISCSAPFVNNCWHFNMWSADIFLHRSPGENWDIGGLFVDVWRPWRIKIMRFEIHHLVSDTKKHIMSEACRQKKSLFPEG